MSKDIIRMAHEAGVHVYPEFEKAFERFANLIRADERQACAKVCDAVAQQMDDEGEGPTGNIGWVIGCAESIRARGNT